VNPPRRDPSPAPSSEGSRKGLLLSSPDLWVDRHGDVLYRYAYSRIHNHAQAEDLVQETFLAALNARSQFKGKSSERTWLLSILRHKLIDQFRRTCRERPAEELGADDPETDGFFDSKGFWKERPDLWAPDPEDLLERSEFWEVFQKCVAGLPGRLGVAFSLRVMDGLEPEETCNTLGVSATNLLVMLHRARARLRRCLEKNWFSGPREE
jgi:RNA polymerase sigma-70 factor (ECF subfamily)